MNNQLRSFYNNEGQREAVKIFMVDMLKDIAVERAFDGKEIGGIQDANECIIKMFDKLEEEYGIIEKPFINNSK